MEEKLLKAICNSYLKYIDEEMKIQYKLDSLLDDEEILGAIKRIKMLIDNKSENFLPTVELDYKVPNISVGKNIDIKPQLVDVSILNNNQLTIDKIEGLENIGDIYWDVETQSIKGKAKNDGSFLLKIIGKLKNNKGFTKKFISECKILSIPDPKSLWKTIEPNKDIPYPKSHEDSKSIESEEDEVKLLYASKRGRSHAHNGIYRDDDGEILRLNNGWSFLIVADGGGSYPLSRRGSEIVVEKTTIALKQFFLQEGDSLEETFIKYTKKNSEELKQELDNKLQKTIFSAAYNGLNGIYNEAKEKNNNPKDYSTTLLIAAHKKTKYGHIITSFWVGDGVIAIYSKDKSITLLGEPDGGDFAGQTRFLDASFFNDLSRVKIKLVDNFTALILATDGVSDPFFPTNKSLYDITSWNDFYENILDIINKEDISISENKLLEWLDFWSIGNHDDRTIALLIPNNNNINKEISVHNFAKYLLNFKSFKDLKENPKKILGSIIYWSISDNKDFNKKTEETLNA